MRWASALSRRPDPAGSFAEAAEALDRRLGGERPDLLLAFASPHHTQDLDAISRLATRRYPGALLCGCSGRGVIGDAREAEEGPALSLTGAALPGVERRGLHVRMESLPDPGAGPPAWRDLLGVDPRSRPKLLLLADPFSIDTGALIEGLDRGYPGAPKFGGLASGGEAAGEHRLLLGREVHRSGAVAVALSGNVEVETVIAQGCRPIGEPMLVTRCRGGLLLELDRGSPLQVLGELYGSLDARDRELMQHSLFLGLDMREERVQYDPGELLVRNIIGADPQTGSIAVGAPLHPVQAVQFVLRDAHAAEEDLRRMLEGKRRARAEPPAGALLFSCTGRGAGLFGHADHDTSLFEEKLGPTPLGGFFCNGEIGPVGGTTFLHGYTSAFALFREPRPQAPGA
jgi:small ligand-binding sensory domain FIST